MIASSYEIALAAQVVPAVDPPIPPERDGLLLWTIDYWRHHLPVPAKRSARR